MRFAAAVVVGEKGFPLADYLVELLADPDVLVRQAARRSLVVLSYYVDAAKKSNSKTLKPQAVDHGPKSTNKWVVRDAQKRWQDWVAKNRTALSKIQVTQDSTTATSETKTK
jgi:hypothetical protein